MTSFERYERAIPQLLDELAPPSLPDYFDDLLRTTATIRQRPAWSALERWLPMGEIARPIQRFDIPWRPIALVALLAAVVGAGLLISTGSSRGLPAPFGPAANGLLLYGASDGGIFQGDPLTGASRSIVAGTSSLTIPVTSRDGRRVAYDETTGQVRYFVADIDGSDVRPLAGTYRNVSSIAWSPDDQVVGITSTVDDRPGITVMAVDGSEATTLPIDRDVLRFTWLPDGRLAFIGAETPDDRCRHDTPDTVCALFLADPDGTNVEMLLPAADFHGLSIDASPDGRSILYVRWDDTGEGMLYLVDLASRTQHPVRFDNRHPDGLEAINNAWFSPDGGSILFDRFEVDSEHWAVIPTSGGSAINIGPAWPRGPEGHGPEARWSPDGTSVIANYPGYQPTSEALRLLDPTREGLGVALPFPAEYLPSWQRTGS
jgi:hypothetical protein